MENIVSVVNGIVIFTFGITAIAGIILNEIKYRKGDTQ